MKRTYLIVGGVVLAILLSFGLLCILPILTPHKGEMLTHLATLDAGMQSKVDPLPPASPSAVSSLEGGGGSARHAIRIGGNIPESEQTSNSGLLMAAETPPAASKRIKTAQLNFQVKDLKSSQRQVASLVAAQNGYIASENETRISGQIVGELLVRVPADNFDRLVEHLLKESIYLASRNIAVQDVTEEYVDIQTRLSTQKDVEQQYRGILKQAKTIKDILAVEQSLAQIRQEIEAKEGRLKFLSNQVVYSTINIHAYQNIPEVQPPKIVRNFLGRAGRAFSDGWDGLLDFILFALGAWPLLLILAVCGWLYRNFRKRSRQKRNQEETKTSVPILK
jgi:hypothetical protein